MSGIQMVKHLNTRWQFVLYLMFPVSECSEFGWLLYLTFTFFGFLLFLPFQISDVNFENEIDHFVPKNVTSFLLPFCKWCLRMSYMKNIIS